MFNQHAKLINDKVGALQKDSLEVLQKNLEHLSGISGGKLGGDSWISSLPAKGVWKDVQQSHLQKQLFLVPPADLAASMKIKPGLMDKDTLTNT